jgi:hypothetical protein
MEVPKKILISIIFKQQEMKKNLQPELMYMIPSTGRILAI